MHTSTIPIVHPEALHSITGDDLLALAGFADEQAQAVSFYFSLSSSPDNSHREEVLMVQQLVRDIAATPQTEGGISKDLSAIVMAAEEFRHVPSRLNAVFACHDRHIWQVFDLPVSGSISRLEVGRHFHLEPLLQALESCAPYCVVIIEHGKARAFVVHGSDIQEIIGRFKAEDLSAHPDNARVGWSHHIAGNERDRARAYFKELSWEIHRFMEHHKCSRLVIGCRDGLWSELEPQFLSSEKTAVIGRFHTANFDVAPHEVLQAIKPIIEGNLQRRYEDLLNKINEGSARSAIGLDQVVDNLEQGRVQKLLLGKRSNEMISECGQCGHLHAGLGVQCVFCGSKTHAVLAEDALIRRALVTEAEILLPGPDTSYGHDDVAALLRY